MWQHPEIIEVRGIGNWEYKKLGNQGNLWEIQKKGEGSRSGEVLFEKGYYSW